MFNVSQLYTKKDIYKILKVPQQRQRGDWDKGYKMYEGNMFIFSNVGIPGRTGHDYNNYWDGDLFVWEATGKSNLRQPQIQKMLYPLPNQKIFLFTRTRDKAPWTFEGNVIVESHEDTIPVKIVWRFEHYPYDAFEEKISVKSNKNGKYFYEGSMRKIFVNKYERNPLARRMCIEHYGGPFCQVCKFDFFIKYGEIGKNYIHVHHLVPISTIGKSYKIIPEKDLIPVCPNCHSMIHKKSPPLKITELSIIVESQEKGQ